ncbi:hypothetical protein ACFZA2_07075 [Microbacterium sp. NPDC007973]|uniref:hypothetical protein n=1 Tax=Microbacterium sp. NPDC007973 TaxID=3364182 RepID=UPI0036E81C19
MPHIELRALTDDHRDAAFDAVSASRSSWPRGVFEGRASFDAWVDRPDVEVYTVSEDGRLSGVAAAMDVDGDREILLAVTPDAGDEAPTEALRQLTVREAERPLYACVSVDDEPAHDMLARIGFVEHERDGADVVYVLPPTLE